MVRRRISGDILMNDNDRKVMFSHKSDEYRTPKKLYDLLNSEFHFDIDAACTIDNCLCNFGLAVEIQDSLQMDWCNLFDFKKMPTIFLNPPYSKIKAFLMKSYIESCKGCTVVCLIPVRSDTGYWHDFVMRAAEIRFIKGRVKYELPDVDYVKNSAPFPSCIVVLRNHYGTVEVSSMVIK